jgi:polysaccharide export outer membrane protein
MFARSFLRLLVVALMSVTFIIGCSGGAATKPDEDTVAVDTISNITVESVEYHIQPGDKVAISVFGEEDLEKEVVVSPDGGISFPLIGDIQAKGKSVSVLRNELKQRLARYIPGAVVSVSILEVVGNKVSVLGQVNKPGEYVLSGATDVLQALSMAGGVTPFASSSKVKILRRDPVTQKQSVIRFNYKDVISGRRLEQNILLRSGDTVVVP